MIGYRAEATVNEGGKWAAPVAEKDAERTVNFERYGFMPELLGRFNRIVSFERLDKDDLKEILRRNTVERYRRELELEGIELRISERVYDVAADECLRKGTGARGLGSSLARHLEDACFEAYSAFERPKKISLGVQRGDVVARVA